MANISKIKAVELILKEIEKGGTFNETLKVIESSFKLSEPTFNRYWKEAKKKYEARQKKVESAKTNHEIKRAIHELETKDGQVNALIEQLNEVKAELESGTTIDAAWIKGTLLQDYRPLNAIERKDRRVLYHKLLAEIRAIRGLDAPKENKVKIETDVDRLLKTNDLAIVEGEGPVKTFKSIKGE